ncbi:Amino acid permease [Aspergillus sclerotialis]|uniref:Amino acid permease n=1 Tax=Aspergillus sclerotialis TaxID=2070753 RepID=A0A3A2ZNB4_9EURO|nr:Amino acid permease [Aspergillus sclerotialis]
MAVVPSLGTGLLVGASQALAVGGPLTLLISYLILSIVAYCLTSTMAQVAAHVPAQYGTLVTHSYRYGSRHFGFAVGYLRWYTLAMMVPFEITTAMVNLGLWEPSAKVAIRITLIILVLHAFNFLPERAFKRTEVMFTGLKLILTIGLLAFSIVMFVSGPPGARGFDYWRNTGPMNVQLADGHLGRAFGVAQCLLYSAISFILLPELFVHQAEQKEDPQSAGILSMSRRNGLQVFALYILSALAMGVVCPSDDPLLTNFEAGVGYSPYIVAMRLRGVRILPSIVTTGILISSVASGRTFLYLSSRTLHALAENGHAPSIFYDRNRFGSPYAAILASGLFSFIAYISAAQSSTEVYNWLMPVITTCGYLSWMSASFIYLTIRRATKGKELQPSRKSDIQPLAAYLGITCSMVLPLANGLTAADPSRFNIRNLIPAYIGIPVFLVLYYGHRSINTSEGTSQVDESSIEERETEQTGSSRIAIHWINRVRSNMGDATDNEV